MLKVDTLIQIEKASQDEYSEVARLWNAAWPEFPVSVPELVERDKFDALRVAHWFGKLDGRAVGLVDIGPVNGSADPRRKTITICVEKPWRQQGIGSQLYDFARNDIEPGDPLTVVTHIHEVDEASIAFARKHGFKETKRDFYSVLDLQNLDLDSIESLASRDKTSGLDFVPGTAVNTPSFRRKLHELFENVRIDIPRPFPPTRLTFEEFEGAFLDSSFQWTVSQFAMKGDEPVGMSTVFASPTEGHLLQGLTAVSRSERRKGIGTILKVEVVKRAIEMGFKTIGTDNDTRNTGMLAINDMLGYERKPSVITFVWGDDGSA